MARISLCMIVRDEEAMLAGCLASVRGAVDDIVVVDTGSVDGTRAIAAAAGARVFTFEWCQDFAAARNEALRHACGDWVLILDADERLTPAAGRALRQSVRRAKFDCGMLRIHDAARVDAPFDEVLSGRARMGEAQLVPRLLRRTDDLKYVDAIHENVLPWLKRRGYRVGGIDVDIVHLGATREVVDAKRKIERNVRLLEARIEKNPDDVVAYGYLAHDHLRAHRRDEAMAVTERGWARLVALGTRVEGSIHRLAIARAYLLVPSRDYARIHETLAFARDLEGDNPDFAFLDAFAHELEARYAKDAAAAREALLRARDGFVRCFGFAGRVYAQNFVAGSTSWAVQTRLGTVHLLLGDARAALAAFEVAVQKKPDDREALLGRAEAMIALGDSVGALRRIESLLDDSPDGWTLAASAASTLGRPRDRALFARRARNLVDHGFVAPHRRERLSALLRESVPASAP